MVTLGNSLGQLLRGEVLFRFHGHVFGDEDIESIGLAVDMGIYPVEFNCQLFRIEGRRAKNTEAAGLADGRDHVTAMAEREQGKFDAKLLAEF